MAVPSMGMAEGLGRTGEVELNQWQRCPKGPSALLCMEQLRPCRDVLPGCWEPVPSPAGLWQLCQNQRQREEGSGLALSCQTKKILVGQEGTGQGHVRSSPATVGCSCIRPGGTQRGGAGWGRGCCSEDAGRHLGLGHGAHF